MENTGKKGDTTAKTSFATSSKNISEKNVSDSSSHGWKKEIIRPACISLLSGGITSELSRDFLQIFFRFYSKTRIDPANFLTNQVEFIAWILYNNSKSIRTEVQDNIRHIRNHYRISNEILQSDLGNSSIEAWDCHTHIPSILTEEYGGEGFARKRILVRCVTCKKKMTLNAPCVECSKLPREWGISEPTFSDRVEGVNCHCSWDREIDDPVRACSECCMNGYVGRIFID